MATNEVTTLRNALTTIIESDATMRTLTGKTSGILVLWRSGLVFDDPTVALLIPSNVRAGGDGDRRQVSVLLGCFASGDGAQDTVEAMTRRIRELLTPAAFTAQGIEARIDPFGSSERGLDPETDQFAQGARHDLDLVVELQAPV